MKRSNLAYPPATPAVLHNAYVQQIQVYFWKTQKWQDAVVLKESPISPHILPVLWVNTKLAFKCIFIYLQIEGSILKQIHSCFSKKHSSKMKFRKIQAHNIPLSISGYF